MVGCLATGMASHLKQQEMNSLRASVRCPAYLQSRYGTCQMPGTAQSTRWSQCKRHDALRKCMQDKCYTAARQCHTCSTHSLATAAGFTSCCASESAKAGNKTCAAHFSLSQVQNAMTRFAAVRSSPAMIAAYYARCCMQLH